MNDNPNSHAAIYGGNGFVGTAIAEELVQRGCTVSCVSRTGTMPRHLETAKWAEKVNWIQGDASNPSETLIGSCDVVICCIGSPPLPTFSKAALEKQVFQNGTTNVNVIESAQKLGVKRLVLIGAQIPKLLDKQSFGYARGKQLAFAAAKSFAETSKEHKAVVLKPGGIFGVRHTPNGGAVRLDVFMGPTAKLQRSFKALNASLVDVKEVANMASNAALDDAMFGNGFHIINAERIIAGV